MMLIYQHREAAPKNSHDLNSGRLASHLATPYTEFAALMS